MGDSQSKPLKNKKEIFFDLLDKMKLTDKYPQKLSLRDAMTLHQDTLGTVHTTDQLPVLPYLIIQKIMMSDQRCRSCLYKVSSSTTQGKPNDSDSESSSLHPVDCMLTILYCCDDILRHELLSKLSFCQLAIPFLLPNPADDSITFLLWAMRSLVRGWKSKNTGGKEHRIVNYQGPIVSFLRIGESKSSKSEILNAVIGGGLQYCFTHRECEGGDCERNFVDGLVEMCCYFPSGKDEDCFSYPITYLNLRGDAQQHQKQVEFIQNISFVSVVLIAKDNINEDTVKLLQDLSKAPGGVILLLAEAKMMSDGNYDYDKESLHLKLPKERCLKIKLKGKNIVTLKSKIQQHLIKKLKTKKDLSSNFKALSDCCEFARTAGIYIDEDNEDIMNGREYAEMVMEKARSVHFSRVKDEMLPLQGQSLWCQWAHHHKEQCRHAKRMKTMTIAEYNRQKDEEKMEVRKNQFNKSTALTPLMDCFIKCLSEENVHIKKYFLQWLKLFLDDRSREILVKLHLEYQNTRDQLNALKQTNESEENSHIKNLEEKQKRLNKDLINASFGLEHLFREMGQIYEARMDCGEQVVSQTLKDKTNHLPQIMAEIMDEGHALELMDGDASHIPVLWVLAVLERLKAVCGKNARETNGRKIFILSVLGIQSSGKSTLLNTMFGLRFNVSAGRCTRGAYIQLLPLDNSLQQIINCDYVLIVDTEGLRAPELQLEGFKHDNELATFVIGLADATIINIFGETPGELDDILQTSLHAFIRMRKVEMNPSCLFVHQNVPDVLASTKNFIGREKFYNKLDNMVQNVAKIENREAQYNSFNQVIDFDDSKDVFYFPGLWKGDPPMAPVNTGYSESAQTLKTELIKLIQRKQAYRCSLETFKLRVTKLWKAVLHENFVFNFKNTLEVFAYNELDSQYAQWSWTLQSNVLEWENITKWKISECDAKTESDLTEVMDTCLEIANDMLLKTYRNILEKMDSFFTTSDHSETLAHWRHKTGHRIKYVYEESRKNVEVYCDHFKKNKLNSIAIERNFAKFDVCIKEAAYEIRKRDAQLSDDTLDQIFEAKWKEFVDAFQTNDFQSMKYPSDREIETSAIEILSEQMQANSTLMIRNLSNKCFSEINYSLQLNFSIDKSAHLYPTKWQKLTIRDADVQLAAKLTDEYLINASKYLEEIQDEPRYFNPSFVFAVLCDLFASVNNVARPETNSSFIFTPEYKVDIGITVCAYAIDIFKEATKKLKEENDPISKLSRYKSVFLTTFKNAYQSANNN